MKNKAIKERLAQNEIIIPFTRRAVAKTKAACGDPDGTWTPGGGEWDDSVPVDEPATGDTPPWNDLPKCPDGEQRIQFGNFAHEVNQGWKPERKWYVCDHVVRVDYTCVYENLNTVYFRTRDLAERAATEIVQPFIREEQENEK